MVLRSMPLRRIITFIFCIMIPLLLMMLFIGSDIFDDYLSGKNAQRLAEYQHRIQYLELLDQSHQEDVAILSRYINLPSPYNYGTNRTNISGPFLDALSPKTRSMIENLSAVPNYPSNLHLPNAFNFLPHLLDDPSSLRPAFSVSRGRQGVQMVLGIPTVKREKQSYLLRTLHNLISNMNENEQNETIIVVFIGETDIINVELIAKQIQMHFSSYVDSGLIDVISPPSSYYPNMEKLRRTLNDSPERVRWRSKQNLDFAFLMAYAQPKAIFYVQLEDDIVTKRDFIKTMKKFALDKTIHNKPWFVLDFCQLGFIGKMFKTADLPWLISFFQMFYNDKPVDWLLDHLLYIKVCSMETDQQHCKAEKGKLWLHYKPSLFQHIGIESSLKGKVQNLQDKDFGTIPSFQPHKNPAATVNTTMNTFNILYSLNRAYLGKSFFRASPPKSGDLVQFIFQQPFPLRKYLFQSGNWANPSALFYNTTVEVLSDSMSENSQTLSGYNSTTDGFLIVGSFNEFGMAQGTIDPKFGKINEIRLHVHTNSKQFIILSEIFLQD